jgi:hypothetical protein
MPAAADDHVAVPKKGERSIITRKGKEHQTNCDKWLSNKKPWSCNAHHILPVTCFNPIEVDPADKVYYVTRCIWVSQWNINGGNKFSTAKTAPENNMVRLPLFSAYKKTYPPPGKPNAPFKKPDHPINQCMHNSSYSEHYLYIREARKYLQANVWDKLQEDKAKHKGKGKNIKGELEDAVKHFRGELETRGNRKSKGGYQGTVDCWRHQLEDEGWWITFSMAHDDMTQCSV